MRKYVPPLLKGKKEKPPVKFNGQGEIDYSENFLMQLHTGERDEFKKAVTSK